MLTTKGVALRPLHVREDPHLDIAPEALAELQPIIPQSYYYADYMGMELEYRYALYGEIYQRNPWVRVVIDKRANAVARLPVNVWDVAGETKTLDTRSAYARLISDPCEYMDPFRFWNWVQTTIDVYGETYLAMVRDRNGWPVSFMPMHPSRVAIRREPKTGVYTYFFEAGSGINTELVRFPERDVVPFRLFNPIHLERGLSKLEALRSTIFADESSRNAVSSMWKNAGRPNVVLETKNYLSEAGIQRLKTAFDQAHAGSTNAGQTLVLEQGVTAKPLQLTAVDLQLIQARQMNREEIAAVFDIPPTLIGILDHATFSNITEQMRAFYRDTMAPVLELIQSTMDTHVGCEWSRRNIMRFAVDEVMRGDYETRMEAAHKGVSVAAITPNEARELLGLNRYDDPKADKLYCNSAIQELGQPGEIIRMNQAAAGVMQGGHLVTTTPDGLVLVPNPKADTTPVAALSGGPPIAVPAPAVPPPATPTAAAPKLTTGPQPGAQTPSGMGRPKRPKHFREVKAQVGRGKSAAQLREFALALARRYPNELEDILLSVQLAIAERDGKEG